MSSPYYQYKKRSAGNVLHFLYHYCGLFVAEMAIIGSDTIYRDSDEKDVLATVSFDKNDYPVFVFQGERADYYQKQQNEKFAIAVKDMQLNEN